MRYAADLVLPVPQLQGRRGAGAARAGLPHAQIPLRLRPQAPAGIHRPVGHQRPARAHPAAAPGGAAPAGLTNTVPGVVLQFTPAGRGHHPGGVCRAAAATQSCWGWPASRSGAIPTRRSPASRQDRRGMRAPMLTMLQAGAPSPICCATSTLPGLRWLPSPGRGRRQGRRVYGRCRM